VVQPRQHDVDVRSERVDPGAPLVDTADPPTQRRCPLVVERGPVISHEAHLAATERGHAAAQIGKRRRAHRVGRLDQRAIAPRETQIERDMRQRARLEEGQRGHELKDGLGV
jgi:hypothetical protein